MTERPTFDAVTLADGTTALRGRNGWMDHPQRLTGELDVLPAVGGVPCTASVTLAGWAKQSRWNSPWQLETNDPQVLRDLARLCTQLADALEEARNPGTQANDARLRALAREAWQRGGECEIDEDARVSVSEDDGAYVAAWVWVTDPTRPDDDDNAEGATAHEAL